MHLTNVIVVVAVDNASSLAFVCVGISSRCGFGDWSILWHIGVACIAWRRAGSFPGRDDRGMS